MPTMSQLDADQVIKLSADEINGALRVNVVATIANLASEIVDNTAYTPSASTVGMIGGEFNDVAPASVTEGNGGAFRMSANRNIYNQIRDAAGNERGVNVSAANALKVDGSAVTQPVSAASLPLPTGASTEATLSALSVKVTACNTGAVVVSSSALPSGASTSAKQDTEIASLASIDGKITTVNTGAVVVSSSALPTGAATETTLAAASAKLPAILGQTTMAASLSVAIASNQSAVPISNTLESASTATISSVNGSASSVSLLASNVSRKGAYFYNDSAAVLYLKFGTTASVTSFTVLITANGFYEMPTRPIYTGAIDGIWGSATGAVRITEL